MTVHGKAQETVCLRPNKAHAIFLPRLELDLESLPGAFTVFIADVEDAAIVGVCAVYQTVGN